jgi:hypothetical protein
MTHAPRRTPGFTGSDLESTVSPDPEKSPSDISIEDSEHVPDEVHSDPELWFDICNDPSIWPENRVAAYRAALRGERDWQFAFADDREGEEATDEKPAERSSRPPSLRGVK